MKMGLFRNRDKIAGENEAFVRLIQIAQEDPEIRNQLMSILMLDEFNRKSALSSFIEQMRFRKAPDEFLQAITSFLDDKVAKKALQILKG